MNHTCLCLWTLSGFSFRLCTCLRRWNLFTPNFDEITQSMKYWNSTSSFDFDLSVFIGMPFCICLPNFIVWDISVNGWGKTSSGFGKQTAAILEFYFQYRFWPACSHRHVILHLRSKFCSNGTIRSGVMTSYWFFQDGCHRVGNLLLGSRFATNSFQKVEVICPPNFDEISIHDWDKTDGCHIRILLLVSSLPNLI